MQNYVLDDFSVHYFVIQLMTNYWSDLFWFSDITLPWGVIPNFNKFKDIYDHI